MKKLSKSVTLLLAIVVAAKAGPVLVDFTQLLAPVNITAPRPPFTLDGFLTMSYEPESVSLPRCGFDAGLGGTLFNLNCVGAHADTSGILGTTDGVYLLDFVTPIASIQFDFGISSSLTVGPDAYILLALFSSGANPADAVLVPGVPGPDTTTMSYSAGPAFDHAELRFYPSDPLVDPDGILTDQHGQTLAQISNMSVDTVDQSAVPEPAAAVLFLTGICALVAGRQWKRVRNRL